MNAVLPLDEENFEYMGEYDNNQLDREIYNADGQFGPVIGGWKCPDCGGLSFYEEGTCDNPYCPEQPD